jgi:hypothetical protein
MKEKKRSGFRTGNAGNTENCLSVQISRTIRFDQITHKKGRKFGAVQGLGIEHQRNPSIISVPDSYRDSDKRKRAEMEI